MKYVIAFMTSIFLIATMLVFHILMAKQIEVWRETDALLGPIQLLLISTSNAIGKFWYLFAPIIVVACLAYAAIFPSKRVPNQ